MARLRVGVTCPNGHFTYFGDLWEPIKDKDVDKLAERSAVPVRCEHPFGPDAAIGERCQLPLEGLPHVEGQERETPRLARVGGKNVHTGLQSRSKDRPKEGPLTPGEWKRQVYDRQRPHRGTSALCIVTQEPLSFSADEAHHCLEKRLLRARGLHHLVWDARNGVGVKKRIHDGHTSALHRIPREALPPCVWEFAREVGPWAVARVEEDHPINQGGST